MVKKYLFTSALICLLLVTTLGGCSTENDPSTEDADQVLVVGITSDPGSMDVISQTDSDWDPEQVIYEPLIAPGYDMEPEPVLAESWERVSPTEWRFYLRQGVKFHDGTDFNASAVKFSLERIQSEGPSWARLPVESIEIEDDYTILITTTEPFAPLVEYFMNINTTGIVSPTAVAEYGDDFGDHPCGTGPFMLSEYVAEQSITLVRNEDYWDGAPQLEKIIYRVIPDASTRVLALKSGDIDVMRALPTSAILELENNSDFKVMQTLGCRTTYYGFNMDKEYFHDVRVRQAMNYAINKQDIVTYILEGIGQAADGFITPSIPGYVSGENYPYDPDEAKLLLAAAGWTDTDGDGVIDKSGSPFEITLVTSDFIPQLIPAAEAIQEQLKQVGIILKIESMEFGALTERVKNRDFDLVADASPARLGGPDYQLMSRFHSTFNSTIHDRTGYVNPQVDALLEAARVDISQDERIAIYQQIQQILNNDAAVIPLFYEMEVVACSSNVQGLKAHPAIWRVNFKDVYITG
nr:ABC transporter substrate-binding protein [Dehalococcoides mccartyi]